MKTFKLIMTLSLLALAACKATVSADDPEFRANQLSWPRYEAKALSGSLFGTVWLAQTAVARTDVSSPSNLIVELYGEAITNACEFNPSISTKPYATVTIPKAYAVKEYQENPMSFLVNGASTRKLVAKRTSLRVETVSSQGFIASFTADGIDDGGAVSEMNGQINVTDCTKAVPFSSWEKMVGNYSLYSFDSVPQDLRHTQITLDQQSFFDRDVKAYQKATVFPLYYSVSASSDASYNFGPIDAKGTTEKSVSGQQTVYTYHYNGPITFRGMDVTLKLDMTVIQYFSDVEIRYTIEVPGQIASSTHKMILKK